MGDFTGWTQDPLQLLNVISSGGSLLQNFMDRRRLQNDPGLLALRNNMIKRYNATTGYDAATGRFGAGSGYGDAASGYGGAYGHDAQGNPLSAFLANEKYRTGQLAGSDQLLQDALASYGHVGGNTARMAGGGATPAPTLHATVDPTHSFDYHPEAVQGVDQQTRAQNAPEAVPLQQANHGLLARLADLLKPKEGTKASYFVGTTSVPEDGKYTLHQGEAVVPRAMNTMAGPPGQAGQPMLTSISKPAPAPMITSGLQNPAAPQAHLPTSLPQGNYRPMAPGLDQPTQNAIIGQGTDAINRNFQPMLHNLSAAAGAAGRTGSGDYRRQMFDAGINRAQQVGDLTRSVGIDAAKQRFADTLAANQFDLSANNANAQNQLALGGLNLQAEGQRNQDQLARAQAQVNEYLGRQQNANTLLGINNQFSLGQGQLAQDRFATGVQRELGLGGLGVQRELGMAQNATAQRGQDINSMLEQLGIRTNAGLTTRQQDITQALQQYQNETARNQGNRGLDIQDYTAHQNAGLANRNLDFNINSFMDTLGLQSTSQQNDMLRYFLDRNDRLSQAGADSQAFGDQQNNNNQTDLMALLAQFV